ncbi:MAG: hypothetical protein ABH812_01050 [bacterium]
MKFLKKNLALILVLLLIILIKIAFVYAGTSGNITATVKLSICGNSIIEGGEDCEGSDLNSETCEGLGYTSGTLSCDIACSYDIYGCVLAPTPTPTPTPISAPTSTPTPTPTSSNTVSETPTLIPTQALVIPNVLIHYIGFLDNNGRFKISSLFDVIKTWVDDWKKQLSEETIAKNNENTKIGEVKKCDVNQDNRCNLVDLSILLYYFSK